MKITAPKQIDLTCCSLMEAAFVSTGGKMIRAGKVVSFVIAWRTVQEVEGRRPTQREYAEYWGVSISTVEKEFHRFREVFPGAPSPSDFPWDEVDALLPADFTDLVAA